MCFFFANHQLITKRHHFLPLESNLFLGIPEQAIR